jgi:hypothetical protein
VGEPVHRLGYLSFFEGLCLSMKPLPSVITRPVSAQPPVPTFGKFSKADAKLLDSKLLPNMNPNTPDHALLMVAQDDIENQDGHRILEYGDTVLLKGLAKFYTKDDPAKPGALMEAQFRGDQAVVVETPQDPKQPDKFMMLSDIKYAFKPVGNLKQHAKHKLNLDV